MIPMAGKTFGALRAVEPCRNMRAGWTWLCWCLTCGAIQDRLGSQLRSGYRANCTRCGASSVPTNSKPSPSAKELAAAKEAIGSGEAPTGNKGKVRGDYRGRVYGQWLCLTYSDRVNNQGSSVEVFRCLGCNAEHERTVSAIRSGQSKSCRKCHSESITKEHSCPCGELDPAKYPPKLKSYCVPCDRRRNRNGTCDECGRALFRTRPCECGADSRPGSARNRALQFGRAVRLIRQAKLLLEDAERYLHAAE